MKKQNLFLITAFLLAVFIAAVPAKAQVSIQIGIPLPQIVFSSPPEVIIIPDTYVYVVPDRDEDIYFYDGWWWVNWDGRWYRSNYYDRGWAHYQQVPVFYQQVPQGWRNDYRNNNWKGHRWDHKKIPYHQVHQNWRTWKKANYWQNNRGWDVQGYAPEKRTQEAKQKPHQQRSQTQKQKSKSSKSGESQGKPDKKDHSKGKK